MLVQHFFINGIAHSSYLLGGRKTCAIIDPSRDVQAYLKAASSQDMKITHILETHLHADFISGHLDLAEQTGAKVYAPKSAECQFDHIGLEDNDIFEIDDLIIKVYETPGHTPEHVSYVVSDKSRGSDPVSLFCGDTLFVGDVGRPDLFPNISTKLASELYDSLHEKLLKLPDFCEVYPAHGSGSLCGRAIGAKRTSTIGYEKKYNAALQYCSREDFVESLTTNMPGAPDHFSRCSTINKVGPVLLKDLNKPKAMEPKVFKSTTESSGSSILDVRSYEAFGSQFIGGSYSNDIGGNFAIFGGWVLSPVTNILLVADNEVQATEATTWLWRVGLDNITGYLKGSMFNWAIEGLPTEHISQLSADELHHLINSKKEMVLLDVRAPSEYERMHIERSYNIPVPDLRTRYEELDPDTMTALICSTGRRSSLGASILKQHHFKNICNVAGGLTGYNAAGYGPECPICTIPHGPRSVG